MMEIQVEETKVANKEIHSHQYISKQQFVRFVFSDTRRTDFITSSLSYSENKRELIRAPKKKGENKRKSFNQVSREDERSPFDLFFKKTKRNETKKVDEI